MTTIESTTGRAGSGRAGNNGVLTVARLNLVGSRQRLGMPWMVVAAVFLVTIVLATIPPRDADSSNPGLLTAFFFMSALAYLQTMTQTFPFALSLGITRRNFYLGTGLVLVVESVLQAVVLTVLRVIERATGGWGLGVRMFDVGFLAQDNPVLQVAAFAAPLIGLSFATLMAGTVFKRWGQVGMYVTALVTTVVGGGLAALATWLGWWPAVGAFFTTTPTLLLVTVLPLVVAALAAVGGYLFVRHATP